MRAKRIYSLEYFERIERQVKTVAELENQITSAYAQALPHGQSTGSIGGTGSHDSFAGIDSMIDSNAQAHLERERAKLNAMLERATGILYGKSGSGGVAKQIDSDAADMLCHHYLQGEGWASMAKRYDAEGVNLTQWAQIRVRCICRQIDRIGMDVLANS